LRCHGPARAHDERARRTDGNAGAAAVAPIRDQPRRGWSPRVKHEANGSGRALLCAYAAFHALHRKACRADLGCQAPWCSGIVALKRPVATGAGAISAEGAYAPQEIDLRVAAVAAYDDVGPASLDAGIAAGAGPQEFGLGEGPRGPQRTRNRFALPSQESPAAQRLHMPFLQVIRVNL
jgi:hypothetical protein